MHYFFLERFLQPAEWFEKRLAYSRSVAASSMVIAFYFPMRAYFFQYKESGVPVEGFILLSPILKEYIYGSAIVQAC